MLIEEMETTTELFLVMELVKVRGGEIPGESVSAASRDLAIFSETLTGNARCCLETFVICEMGVDSFARHLCPFFLISFRLMSFVCPLIALPLLICFN